jgi:hypothetical protein
VLDDIPLHVRQFLEERIHSVAQLELLLLLKKDAGRTWTAQQASQTLAVPIEVSATQLSELHVAGLLAVTAPPHPQFRYQPKSNELDELVGNLEKVYEERRVSVITLIYSKPVDKVRTFADAFRLRKD